jgi:HTH-type transcriptional regulator/antitoxin HigA
MIVRQITNDTEHAAALAELGRLWNAQPGTPEHEELQALGAAVSAYEDERIPLPNND